MSEKVKSHIISFKVSPGDKKTIQEMAKKARTTVSQLVRIKSLSSLKNELALNMELARRRKEIEALKVAIGYLSPDYSGHSVLLELNQKQGEILREILSNYYPGDLPFEQQLLRYLAEDLSSTHFHLMVATGVKFRKDNPLFCIRDTEQPFGNEQNRKLLFEAFSFAKDNGLQSRNQLKKKRRKSILLQENLNRDYSK